jgi:hypothetical protein
MPAGYMAENSNSLTIDNARLSIGVSRAIHPRSTAVPPPEAHRVILPDMNDGTSESR